MTDSSSSETNLRTTRVNFFCLQLNISGTGYPFQVPGITGVLCWSRMFQQTMSLNVLPRSNTSITTRGLQSITQNDPTLLSRLVTRLLDNVQYVLFSYTDVTLVTQLVWRSSLNIQNSKQLVCQTNCVGELKGKFSDRIEQNFVPILIMQGSLLRIDQVSRKQQKKQKLVDT